MLPAPFVVDGPLDVQRFVVAIGIGGAGRKGDGAVGGSVQRTGAIGDGLQRPVKRAALDGGRIQHYGAAIAGNVSVGVIDRRTIQLEDAAVGGFKQARVGGAAPSVQVQRLAGYVGVDGAA
jgi:hypothetical protein